MTIISFGAVRSSEGGERGRYSIRGGRVISRALFSSVIVGLILLLRLHIDDIEVTSYRSLCGRHFYNTE